MRDIAVVFNEKVRQACVDEVKAVFDDADVDVLMVREACTDEYKLVVDLDFGMTQKCYCCELLDFEQLKHKPSFHIGHKLAGMIESLLKHTGRS